MIYISVGLSNPWGKPFNNLWNKSGMLTKHKAWEAEVTTGREIVGFSIRYVMRQSHAGLSLDLSLFGYCAAFEIYDTRHWDIEKDDWEVYEHTET